ncbi:MAG: M3 family metallopeptidase [Roseateles asaccharophilus]|uniref:Thimet oligopeptidase n=1 Tax=Roseateles asaccharophilus TaxID=582607 RepID=A0A4R6MYT1_9BURK|nr:M3 family metallopeptidase [Roseateles asaccharophilus]MDN3545407.1 M3 family metallopeptidase [Roseateles asaccharophilus]TDP07787.1 thimet oligopeptidase [Roseateles asaccharophilus]
MKMKMHGRLLLGGLVALGASQALARGPAPAALPIYQSAPAVKAACDKGLLAAQQRLKALERRKVDASWLAAFDDFYAFQEDTQYPLDFMLHVHPSKAVREAAQACSLRWADFSSSFSQNEKLYKALKRAPTADAIDRELVIAALAAFEDGGVALPPKQRQRAKQLSDQLTELNQQFDKNIRDAGIKLAFAEAELKGVPAAVWEKAPRDEQGRVVLGVDYPSYVPVMQSAELETTRERMWRAKVNEGGEANLQLLDQIAAKRREYAGLFGFSNYADFNLRRRMAKDGATAQRFLDDVKSAVVEGERSDVQALRQAKAEHLGLAPEAVTVQRWDASFYTERIRKQRFSVDQEAFRQYFPPQESLAFTLRVIEKMMGVRYTPVKVKTWHAEVLAYAVSDVASGKSLGMLYVDLYPREGKYNHAAVWPLRSSATRIQRTPTAALVVNFDRQGLTLDEMETLLHELGHAVHNNLSATRYAAQGGTSVMHDFVEAPSQMLEDWVYDKQVLKLMQEVCPGCKPVPDALIDQAVAAKGFAKGSFYGRQHLYASYDLALYGSEPQQALPLWARMEGATPLGHVPGTMFPAGFAHIAGGYGAGYYGYLWSLVLAMDLRTAFQNGNKLNPEVGKRYRDIVLGNGGQKPAPELVREFLQRDSNSKAFFEELRKP